jgi:hypothetical protein
MPSNLISSRFLIMLSAGSLRCFRFPAVLFRIRGFLLYAAEHPAPKLFLAGVTMATCILIAGRSAVSSQRLFVRAGDRLH